MPAGFCRREARESQCKSRQFLKKITCVDKYLLRAIKMSFLCFFLKLELHSKLFKGSAPWISADETINGYVGETHFQPLSWQPASFGESWIVWGRLGGHCCSHHFLKMTGKLLGLPNLRPAEHHCFCCWFICWKQVREKAHSLCFGEGNGSPLQCSCLENPRDGGAWWAAVCGVTQSQTRLKRLSSSSSSCLFWIPPSTPWGAKLWFQCLTMWASFRLYSSFRFPPVLTFWVLSLTPQVETALRNTWKMYLGLWNWTAHSFVSSQALKHLFNTVPDLV